MERRLSVAGILHCVAINGGMESLKNHWGDQLVTKHRNFIQRHCFLRQMIVMVRKSKDRIDENHLVLDFTFSFFESEKWAFNGCVLPHNGLPSLFYCVEHIIVERNVVRTWGKHKGLW
jgi:hypothetical protein